MVRNSNRCRRDAFVEICKLPRDIKHRLVAFRGNLMREYHRPSGISTLLDPDSVRSQLGSIGININDLIQIGAAAAFGTAGITPQTDPALYSLLRQLELGTINVAGTNQVCLLLKRLWVQNAAVLPYFGS